eukprot:5572909-Pyramimonas_sp.AAC.1
MGLSWRLTWVPPRPALRLVPCFRAPRERTHGRARLIASKTQVFACGAFLAPFLGPTWRLSWRVVSRLVVTRLVSS